MPAPGGMFLGRVEPRSCPLCGEGGRQVQVEEVAGFRYLGWSCSGCELTGVFGLSHEEERRVEMLAPARFVVDVMLILVRDGRVLLARRQGTGYADGWWNLPSGKLEAGEDLVTALRREAREEVGVEIDAEEPRLVAVVHHRNPEGEARIGVFFEVRHSSVRHAEPRNAEPHKCSEIAWFPLFSPPHGTHGYTARGLDLYLEGLVFGLDGW